MAHKIVQILHNWLIDLGVSTSWSNFIMCAIIVVSIISISILANWLAKGIILNVIKQIIKRTKNNWDDILLEKRVFHRFSHIAPALVFYYSAEYFLGNYKVWHNLIHSGVHIYLLVIVMLIISSFLNALNAIYSQLPSAPDRPIRSYLQVVNIFNYSIITIIILSILLDKDPSYFLTGLGAIAAVLMLVFKDSLLGLVAGIQLSANNMVKLGDWIVMQNKNADGLVTEISLNTVKVQNWDKTITLIPSYSLVSEAFINYRGMEESGARRMKRAIYIDMKTIRFLSEHEINGLKKIALLKDYLSEKELEINEHNKQLNADNSISVNGRRLTNIGTFRKYCELYLQDHPHLRKDLTMLVRQLQPTEAGLPIELYFFSQIIDWIPYENIQSDIFDHLYAIIPAFHLKVFQNPSQFEINSNPS